MTNSDDVFDYIVNANDENRNGNKEKGANQLTVGGRQLPATHEDGAFDNIINPDGEKTSCARKIHNP